MPPQQRAARRQPSDQFVGETVPDLISVLAVRIQPNDRANDRADCLAPERRNRIREHYAASESRRFDGCRGAGDSGAEHADVSVDRGYVGCSALTNHRFDRLRHALRFRFLCVDDASGVVW
jgi:hypothetical protein